MLPLRFTLDMPESDHEASGTFPHQSSIVALIDLSISVIVALQIALVLLNSKERCTLVAVVAAFAENARDNRKTSDAKTDMTFFIRTTPFSVY